MPTQASQFDLLTAFLDTPVPIQYGVVRGAGKLVLQHELSDKSRIACYLLGEGPWDSLQRLWINRLSISLPDTTKVHFHPGDDGEIGAGMAATSTGGDQKVDAFWSSLPGSLSVVDFSRYANLWVKAAPDPGAPSADLEVLGDYQALRMRIFDNAGVQTSFAWSQNRVWCALDYLLRKLVLREARINQPLIAEQKALFDFGLLKAAADYADVDIGGGVKRFSDGGLVWIQDGLTADRAAEQLLLMCRSFLGERNGKIFVMERKDEASSFTLTLDDIEPGSFVVEDGVEEGAFNQIIPAFRDSNLASGSTDNLTRMAESTPEPLNHESHQLAVGFAGKGLARIRDATPLSIDLGVNTPERAWRIGKSLLLETLGDEADPGVTYRGLRRFNVTALEHTVEIVPGDVVTIDRGVSEEWSGAKFRVQKAVELPDGRRELSGRQHNPNAYPDTAPAQQANEAPAPGTGLAPLATGVDATGNQVIGVSTALNPQGNIPASSQATGIFTIVSFGSGVGGSIIKLKWAAFDNFLADGTTLNTAASTALAAPAAPTLSQVAGGALGARTYYVRTALVKGGLMLGISPEASLAVNANNLLKVSSPANVTGYDGWVPLVGIASSSEVQQDGGLGGGALSIASPVAFGADWTEPSGGANTTADGTHTPLSSEIGVGRDSVAQGIRMYNLAASTSYKFYPTLKVSEGFPFSPDGPSLSGSAQAAAKQSGDGMRALSNGPMSYTTSLTTGTNSGSGGGGGGGGRGTM